jgi:hypothetical protein
VAADFELHLERDLDVAYEAAEHVLEAGPREWLPGFAQEGERVTAELAFEQSGRRVTRRVEVLLGTVQPFAYGVAVRVEWEGARRPQLYPRLEGHLRLERGQPAGSALRFDARYAPPAGWLGAAADRALMHHVAESSVADFVDGVAGLLVRGGRAVRERP